MRGIGGLPDRAWRLAVAGAVREVSRGFARLLLIPRPSSAHMSMPRYDCSKCGGRITNASRKSLEVGSSPSGWQSVGRVSCAAAMAL